MEDHYLNVIEAGEGIMDLAGHCGTGTAHVPEEYTIITS